MNLKSILLALSIVIAGGCSSSYKNARTSTTDDLYYSPARPAGIVKEDIKKDQPVNRRSYADRQIVMSIYDPRWRGFNDDYSSNYDPYHYGYNYGYYYNPYYYPSPVYVSGSVFTNPKNTTPRMIHLGAYNYSNMVVVDGKNGSTQRVKSTRLYNNRNSDNYIRRVTRPSNNSSFSPTDNNSRSYSPSNNSATPSSPARSSSGTPVARPGRGGK